MLDDIVIGTGGLVSALVGDEGEDTMCVSCRRNPGDSFEGGPRLCGFCRDHVGQFPEEPANGDTPG